MSGLPPSPEAPRSDRTLMLILAYLGPLSVVPLLVEKGDREVQWHSRNGLALFVVWAILCLIDVFIVATLQIFGCIYTLLMMFAGLVYLALMVLGIAKALRGERLLIPGISSLAARF
jgi:uncharacterized membrane protein